MSTYVLYGNPGWGSAIVEAQLAASQRKAVIAARMAAPSR